MTEELLEEYKPVVKCSEKIIHNILDLWAYIKSCGQTFDNKKRYHWDMMVTQLVDSKGNISRPYIIIGKPEVKPEVMHLLTPVY